VFRVGVVSTVSENEKDRSFMKKLSIVLAIAIAAFTAQAASFEWTVGFAYYTGQSVDNAGTVGITGSMWLVNVTSVGSAAGISVDGSGNLILAGGDTIADSAVFTGNGTSFVDQTTTANAGQLFVVVGYDSVGNKYGIGTTIVDANTLALTATTVNGAIPGNGVLNSQVFANVLNDPYDLDLGPSLELNITPVPEPASMALFGLGAGVLALRRRFKSKKA
jgi:hypothetical protein